MNRSNLLLFQLECYQTTFNNYFLGIFHQLFPFCKKIATYSFDQRIYYLLVIIANLKTIVKQKFKEVLQKRPHSGLRNPPQNEFQ